MDASPPAGSAREVTEQERLLRKLGRSRQSEELRELAAPGLEEVRLEVPGNHHACPG